MILGYSSVMRRDFTKQLEAWRTGPKRKPLMILGARQIGKTYSLLEFGANYFPNYHYINLDKEKNLTSIFSQSLDPKKIIRELEISLSKQINTKTDLLIIDEIQECPLAITSLKYFCEEMPELAVCSAGSLLGVKLGNVSFPVGKVALLNMFPMTFLEFIEALGEDLLAEYIHEWSDSKFSDSVHAKAWELLKIYMIVGGLPEAVLSYIEHRQQGDFSALNHVRLIQETLTQTYLSDMAKHSGKENALHLERIWSNVPVQLGREQDGSADKFKFKGVLPKISNYSRLVDSLDWLLAAGLLIKVPIVNTAQMPLKAYTEENRFKLFMFDIGLLGSIAGISPKTILDYDYGTYKGFFAENLVAMELSTLFASRDKLYCWREGESEIEFLQEINDKLVPIEVKSGFNTRSRSLAVYAGKYQPDLRVIISAQNYSRNAENNLVKLPLYLVSKIVEIR